MTRARLILTLRLGLLCLALAALCASGAQLALWAFASFAWVPLGLFMPVFATPGGTSCLSYCSDGPPTASCTYSGIANGDCTACTQMNGTYVTDLFFDGSNQPSPFCTWGPSEGISYDGCNSHPDTFTYACQVLPVGGNTVLKARISFMDSVAVKNAEWGDGSGGGHIIGPSPAACISSGPYTPTLNHDFLNATTDCSAASATCTVAFSA